MTPQPIPGTYACVRTGGFLPWLIRLGTRSSYNHAFIVVDDTRIIEADPGGARWNTLDAYAGHQLVYNNNEPITDDQRKQVVARAETFIGTPYGWTDIARLSLRSLGLNWAWLTARADKDKAVICSQLVAICGDSAGLDWNCGRDTPAAVTPGDLAARIARQPAPTAPPRPAGNPA
jgi:uncharacterized protein YycO